MTAEFIFKRPYGKTRFYPDNELAVMLCELAGRKCFDRDDFIRVLKMRKVGILSQVFVIESPTKPEKLTAEDLLREYAAGSEEETEEKELKVRIFAVRPLYLFSI